MLRTIVSLEEQDKRWLDTQAKRDHVPMTEIVRIAIKLYRKEMEVDKSEVIRKLLEKTRGIWHLGDGLQYQKEIRDEWHRTNN